MTRTAAAAAAAPARSADPRSPWPLLAGAAAVGAGGLHVAAAVEHLPAGDLVVGFFLLTALAQVGIGLWSMVGSWLGRGPGTGPVAAALAGTVVLVGLYLVVHTTDLLTGLTGHELGHEGHPGSGSEAGQAASGHHDGAATESEGPVALGGAVPAAVEPPDLLGTVTVALELLTVLALTALLPGTWRRRTVDALLALGALVWAAWLTGVLG